MRIVGYFPAYLAFLVSLFASHKPQRHTNKLIHHEAGGIVVDVDGVGLA